MSKGPASAAPAYELDAARYVGKVCSTHPDHGGLRIRKNNKCVSCYYEKKYLKKAAARAAVAIGRKVGAPAGHHFGKPCVKHPELLGLRHDVGNQCPQCGDDFKTARDLKAADKARHREEQRLFKLRASYISDFTDDESKPTPRSAAQKAKWAEVAAAAKVDGVSERLKAQAMKRGKSLSAPGGTSAPGDVPL